MTELSQKFYQHINSTYLERLDATNLKVSRFRFDGVNKKDLSFLIEDKEVIKAIDAMDYFFLSEQQQQTLVADVSNDIFMTLRRRFEVPESTISTKGSFSDLTPCLDIESKEGEYFMLSSKTGWISKVTYKAWEKVVPKEMREQILKNTVFATRNYMPYSLAKHIKLTESDDHSAEECVVNTCVQPNWRYSEEKISIKPMFDSFMDNLFTTSASKQFVINWIHESIYGRNGTYLVMCGRKGIGKNILSEACSYMVGARNYMEAPRSALTKEFNTYLKDKRIVLMDEISFRENREKDKLKSYLNNFQAVEGKGIDAKMIELYCSIILSSNNVKDMNIEPDDRRFAVADLSQVPLLDTIGEQGIEDLIEYIRSEEFPIAFNNYLEKNRDRDFNPNRPYKGPTFRELCISSLTVWQTAIYEAIVSVEKPKYFIKDLMTTNPELFPKRHNDYTTFLENFTVDDKTIGRYERGSSVMESEIIPNEIYLPVINDDLD